MDDQDGRWSKDQCGHGNAMALRADVHSSSVVKRMRSSEVVGLLEMEDSRSEEEMQAVEEFRKELAEERNLQSIHDDYHTILRFLKARKFDISKTKLLWLDWLKWREDFGLEKFGVENLTKNFQFDELMDVKEHYPMGHHGVDREGHPVYIELIGRVNASKVLEVTTMERYIRYHVMEFERTFRDKFPACTINAGRHIDKITAILDVSGLGFKNFTNDARTLLAKLSKIDSYYYPETLHRLLILNAGPIFRTIWMTVKRMMDPRTVAKILFVGANRDILFEVIDPSQLPTILGGTCTCEGVEGGCLRSDKGPWQDPAIMKVVHMALARQVAGQDHLEGAGSSTLNPLPMDCSERVPSLLPLGNLEPSAISIESNTISVDESGHLKGDHDDVSMKISLVSADVSMKTPLVSADVSMEIPCTSSDISTTNTPLVATTANNSAKKPSRKSTHIFPRKRRQWRVFAAFSAFAIIAWKAVLPASLVTRKHRGLKMASGIKTK